MATITGSITESGRGAESTFLGTTNRVVVRSDQTEGTVGIVEITLQPGSGAPLHTNTRESLSWYVVEGTMSFHSDGEMVDVAAGGAVFFPRGHTHAFANRTSKPARALLVGVPGGFEEFLLELGGKLPAEAPSGPPPEAAIGVLAEVAHKYGLQVHLG